MTETASPSLAARVRRGALWNVATTLILKLVNILITAVVARILDPQDFGVFAVAVTAFVIVAALGEFGVAACLIRADLDIDAIAPTMVTVSLVTSAAMAGALIVFATPIAAALGSAQAADPVKVMAIPVIVSGLTAVPAAQLTRDFKQDKLFLANAISVIPSTAALLLLAKSGSGAMAFAWSRALGNSVAGGMTFVYARKIYLPGLTRSAMSLLVSFGLPLAGAQFVNYILLNVDYAAVGHLLGPVALGTYVLAFNVASWPSSLLGTMINNVAMPAFSRVRHDADLMRDSIINSLRALSLVVVPMCWAIIVLARPLVLTLYGAKWVASASTLSYLSLYSAISIACLLFTNILSSMGNARVLLLIQLAWLAELIPAMALGVQRDGIIGAAFAHIAVIVPVILPCYLLAMRRTTGVRPNALLKAVLPAVLASSAAALIAKFITTQVSSPLIQLITGLSAFGLVYVIAIAPQVIKLLGREQITNQHAARILYLFDRAIQPASRRFGDSLMTAAGSVKRRAQQAPETEAFPAQPGTRADVEPHPRSAPSNVAPSEWPNPDLGGRWRPSISWKELLEENNARDTQAGSAEAK
jgi:lipopolysaccharide exporter